MIVEMTGGTRRRRRAAPLTTVVVALGLLAGCAQSNTPTGYDEVTRENFIEGCMGEGSNLPGASEETCVCAYDWISLNVPFNSETRASVGDYAGPDFVDLDKTLRNSPEQFPQEITDVLSEQCPGWGTPGSGSDQTDSTAVVGPMAPGTSIVVDTTTSGQSGESEGSATADTTM